MNSSAKQITVFHPFKEPGNYYLKEIANHFDGVFHYGSLFDTVEATDLIHIHWPEAIFDWKEPSNENLLALEQRIVEWKKATKIIYTRHNEFPHQGSTNQYERLYQLVEQSADVIIHLGQYSFEQFDDKGIKKEEQKHVIIPHPVYTLYPNTVSREQARISLNLKKEDKVVLCLGNIRNSQEARFLMKVFRQIEMEKKILIAPTMDYYLDPFNNRLISSINKRVLRLVHRMHPQYRLENKIVEDDALQLYLNAADVLFIPRLDSLNSGLLLLGISFDMPVVCPNTGNNTETIRQSNSFGYEPGNPQRAAEAIFEAIHKPQKPVPLSFLENRHPKQIAELYHKTCTQLLDFHGD